MTKPWQVCLALTAIFFAGMVSGGLLERHIVRRNPLRPPPATPEVWIPRMIKGLEEKLTLTSEQSQRIGPIVKTHTEELSKLRRQSMRTAGDILTEMETQIAAELTPEQKTRYEEILKERREMRRSSQHLQHHGDQERPPGSATGETPPPPPPPSAGSAGT